MHQGENIRNEGNSNMTVVPTSSPSYSSLQRSLLPYSRYIAEESTFVNLYSSIFVKESPSSSQGRSPSPPPCVNEYGGDGISATQHCLHASQMALMYCKLEKRYELCLSRLSEVTQELEALRQENLRLRKANIDLTCRRLNPLKENVPLGAYDRNRMPISPLADEFRRLSFGRGGAAGGGVDDARQGARITLPKCISIRSSGYLKAGGSVATSSRGGRVRVSNPVFVGAQQAYAATSTTKASTREELEALELEVYAQGMFKTELCNKWEETGACPYGDHCQFAHGVSELRPIIRHPRYKTEICRMVLAGETCPYGHRCHFRHALSPEDHYHMTSRVSSSSLTSIAP